MATLTFMIEVVRHLVQVALTDATVEGGLPGCHSGLGNDGGGNDLGMLAVRTLDDQRVEPTEAFTVTLSADPLIEITEATATGGSRTTTRRGCGNGVWGWCWRAWGGRGGRDRRAVPAAAGS